MNWDRIFSNKASSRWDKIFGGKKTSSFYRSIEDQDKLEKAAKAKAPRDEDRMLISGLRSESAYPLKETQNAANKSVPNIIETPPIEDEEISDFRNNGFADSYQEIRAPQTLLSDQDVEIVLEWLKAFDNEGFINKIQKEEGGVEIVSGLVERLYRQAGEEVPEHWRDDEGS